MFSYHPFTPTLLLPHLLPTPSMSTAPKYQLQYHFGFVNDAFQLEALADLKSKIDDMHAQDQFQQQQSQFQYSEHP